ncbi:MAG: hypothetical protein DMD99_04270 [Candidatus Rokuibacteriota bacterium]|jgi:hypothetical protein|nr:MAG: hypothetical protein DMD99_04270 [Candidatus Rokubacteria bacterium]
MLKRATTARLTAAAIVLGAMVGCASAPIAGRLTLPGQEPDRVILSYRSSLLGGSGKLWTTLPAGERFTGTYVLQPGGRDAHMTGTLAGDRGGVMVCRFRLNEPGVGPDKGGTVRCDLSTGGVFDASF